MSRAIREHSRDVLAIIGLVAAGIFSLTVILLGQGAKLPNWVPAIGSDRFELKAEFSTAQSVTPGQGQAVQIAGINVGDITGVELEEGSAVVTMQVDNKYSSLVNEDASMLLRPKTGLNDMVIQVDPGTSEEDIEEGATLPLASTQPNVNPDEILAGLDADTQGFLKLLLAGGAQALDPEKGRDLKLSAALRQLEPFARDVARINSGLAVRRENIKRSIHNFQLLSTELADNDEALTSFVDSSDAALSSFARQEASIRAALRELPGTLRETRDALEGANELALQAGPALKKLIPGAKATGPALRALRPFFQETVAPIRDQIRPFTVQVRGPVTNLAEVAKGLGRSTPGLKVGFTNLNTGLNALAFNPPGQEGYLFYIPWLNHNLNANYLLQDAYGPLRRGLIMVSCSTATIAEGTLLAEPYLRMLYQLTGQFRATKIPGC